MLTAAIGTEDQGIHDERAHRRARAAMYAVADGLTGKGLDILGQEWEEQYYLKAANAWGALCEATIGANGLFSWEYRAVDGRWTDPAQIAAMTMILLGADSAAEARTGPSLRYPGQTFKSAVGLTARAHGMHARLHHVASDEEFLEIGAEIEVTNPTQPGRGRVLVRDSAICWECSLAYPDTGNAGLDAAEIVETIGRSVPQLRVLQAQLAAG